MNALKPEKKNLLLYSAAGVCFLLSYSIIAYHNRHSSDDFDGIFHVQDKGIFGSCIYLYTQWEGSYAQGLTYYPLSYLFQSSRNLIYFNLLNLFFIAICFYFLLQAVLNYLKIQASSWEKINFISIFLGSLLFTTANISEDWFWLNGSVSYLTPLGFLALGLAAFLQNRFLISAILLFWFCGYRFNYNVLLASLWATLSLHQLLTKKNIRSLAHLLPGWIAIIMGSLIYILAPGNTVRKTALDVSSTMNLSIGELVHQTQYFLQCMAIRIPFFVLLTLPLVVWCMRKKINLTPPRKFLLFYSIFLFAYLVLHLLLMTKVYNRFWYGEQRTWIIFQLFLYPYVIMLLAPYLQKWINPTPTFLFFSVVIFGVLYAVKIIPALPNLNRYASAYDQRMITLEDLKIKYSAPSNDTIKLNLLPPPYPDFVNNEISPTGQCRRIQYVVHGKLSYLRYGDIAPRKTVGGWINEGIEKALDLPFYIDVNQGDASPRK